MKRLLLFVFLSLATSMAYSQGKNDELPYEFIEVARKAFLKTNSTTSTWFAIAAKQHPSGSFDTTWAKKKLIEKFTGEDINKMGELLMVMMAYQRMVNKEVMEDKKMASPNNRVLPLTPNTLKMDNTAIDQQVKEAEQKADNAITSANINVWTGIVSGASSLGVYNDIDKQSQSLQVKQGTIQKGNSQKSVTKNISPIAPAQKTQQKEKDFEGERKTNADQERAMKSSIQKLLSQQVEMSKRINL